MENEAKIERIKTLMENFGVTQSEFAKRISIDASNFSKHLTGKLPVSDSLINRIVADLGVSKEWLCTGKGYMFRPSDNDAHSHIRTLTLPSEAIIPEARNGAKVYGLDVTAGNLARDHVYRRFGNRQYRRSFHQSRLQHCQSKRRQHETRY